MVFICGANSLQYIQHIVTPAMGSMQTSHAQSQKQLWHDHVFEDSACKSIVPGSKHVPMRSFSKPG